MPTALWTPRWYVYSLPPAAARRTPLNASHAVLLARSTRYSQFDGNALMFGGSSAMWELLMGRTFTPFDADNAYIGVGDGTAATDPGQTDLQGATTVRTFMVDGYPSHTVANSQATISVEFRAAFGAGQAEFVWNEVGLFNAGSGGRMFNRRVKQLGAKPVGYTKVVACAFEIQPETGST